MRIDELDQLSRLTTAEVDRSLLSSWLQRPSTGYELVRIDGRLPDDLLEPWLELEHVMGVGSRDGGQDDGPRRSAERYRTTEAEWLRLGHSIWRLVARLRASGALAGATALAFPPYHPDLAWQRLTAVRPEHRGHGLGRWLKAALTLRLLDERPTVTRVETWNARSNTHMIAINQAMGFEVIRRTSTWQAETSNVAAAMSPRRPRQHHRSLRPPAR